MKYFNPSDNIIFKCITGSQLYGTATEDSDIDYVSVCIAPLKKYLSNRDFHQTQHHSEEEDYTIYNIKKAVKLMADNNPNMIELLYIPNEYIVKDSSYWQELVEHRDWFLSKKAKFTFSGYAHSQLRRLRNHKKWLDKDLEKPERKDFGLGSTYPINNNHEKAILTLPNKYIVDDLKPLIRKERKFRSAMKEWKKYKQWKEKRNPKRYALEKKIGYDAKHVMHLYRLMLMAVEILEEGKIIVNRRENGAKELMEIRNCEWEYDKLIDRVEFMDNKTDELYDTSELQHSAKYDKIDELMIEIIKEYNKE